MGDDLAGAEGVRILHVDDDRETVEAVASALEGRFPNASVVHETNGVEALDHLDDSFTCVVSEHDLPEVDGLELLRSVRESYPDLPFVLFTGSGSERLASEAVSADVSGYFRKGEDGYDEVADRIEEVVSRYRISLMDERVRERLEEAKDRLQWVVARVDDVFVAVDGDWRITHLNDHAARILDRTPQEAIGTVLWEAAPDMIDTPLEEQFWKVKREGEPATFETYYDPAGAWFEVRAYPDDDGLSVFLRDITDRQDRERRLRESRDRIEALYDAAVDLAGSETEAEVSRRIVEAAQDVLDHDLCSVGLRDDDRLRTRDVSKGPVESYEGTPLDASGSLGVETYGLGEPKLIEDLRETPYADDDGQFRAAISVPLGDHGVFQAVSHSREAFDERDLELAELLGAHAVEALERIARERKLREHERDLERKNERLEAFASVVSHDLRNPIEVARGSVELARRTDDEEAFEEILDALDRMEELIEDVLQLARDPGPVDGGDHLTLSSVVHEAWGNVSATGGDLTVEVPDEWTVRADRGQLKRLLENLFANAVEHGTERRRGATTDAGAAAPEDGSPVRIRVGVTDGGFFVADDGPGIPESDRGDVFDPGVSGGEGTGLGLSIVSRIAEAHGWEVEVSESEDGGARFEFLVEDR